MYEGFDIWAFLSGLPLGLVVFGIIWFFIRKKGKKDRIFDERYRNLHRHARSISWMVTAVAILVAWLIVMLLEGAKLAFFILSALWTIHMLSWLIGAAIANKHH